MIQKKILKLFFIFVFLTPLSVWAEDPCIAYQNYSPLPEWYSRLCTGQNKFRSVVGGAYSSYADAFNLNPASLPTHLMPAGFEYLLSKRSETTTAGSSGASQSQTSTQFSLIKGMKDYGIGFSSDSDDTIYSNRPSASDQQSRTVTSTSTSYSSGSLLPNLNFGGALGLESILKKAAGGESDFLKHLSPNIGLILRYDKTREAWGSGAGFSLNAKYLSFGLSIIREPETVVYKPATAYTVNPGLKIGRLQIEYVRIVNNAEVISTIQIYTMSTNIFGVLVTGALRETEIGAVKGRQVAHLAAKVHVSPKVSLGYLYNYVPGAHSLSLQVMF